MENKMRKQETAEAMGRGRDTLTRRNFSKRRQRGGFAKKGMAYFLSFLMLAGNLQSVSYAEEIAGETVERIALATEEKSSESLRERAEEKVEEYTEKAISALENLHRERLAEGWQAGADGDNTYLFLKELAVFLASRKK